MLKNILIVLWMCSVIIPAFAEDDPLLNRDLAQKHNLEVPPPVTDLSPAPMWLQKKPWPLVGVTVTEIWEWTPFFTLICLSGLAALPLEPYEAAQVDGASRWQVFFYVTFPLLLPVVLVGLLIRLIDVFRIFDIIYIMTEGGPGNSTSTLSIFVHRTGFIYRHLGYASAASYIMIAVLIVLSTLLIRVLSRVGL